MPHYASRLAALALAAATAAAAAAPAPAPGPTIGAAPQPANPAAVVRWASARFTVLTPRLLRLELAGRSGEFDDRPTLATISRLAGATPPPFTVSTAGGALTLSTGALTLVYAPPGGNVTAPPSNASSTCALAQPGFDVADGGRVPRWPDGANATDQAHCCALCDADADCSAWVFAVSPAGAVAARSSVPPAAAAAAAAGGGRRRQPRPPTVAPPAPAPTDVGANCWLMMGVTALAPVGPSRVAGALLPFDGAALNVSFRVAGAPAVWRPGAVDDQNLRGAFHALDCYDVPANCIAAYDAAMRPGLLSRSGWAVVDDTSAARLVAADPSVPSPVPFWYANATAATRPAADLYLYAHGHDYAGALADFARVSGPPALPPASVFGVWWSHWEPFNQSFFEADILANYRAHALPLHHVMLDVDWHTELGALPTNASVPCYGYGGYTVNERLWPAWPAFVASLKDGSNPSGYAGLRLMLNLHPNGGTDACQRNWPAFARLVNTTSSAIVPCSFGNQRIASASFAAFMDADVLAPVDGWWTDYDNDGDCFDAPTASTPSSYPGMAWQNEVFGRHQVAARGRRPLLLSRSGGLGAHRNPVSFSGDANQHQDVLRWQLENTPLAANVLHGTWSHDVGGFMCQSLPQANCSGDASLLSNGLLYLRWIQAAVSLPVLRTHASTWNLTAMERRVWMFPPALAGPMMEALRLRSALRPYIYSEARAAHDTGLATVRKLYFDFPERDEAYDSSLTGGPQHLFGSALLASSIYDVDATAPRAGDGALGSARRTWFPPTPEPWTDLNGTASFVGPLLAPPVFYGLGDIPLFARQGAVIPMQTLESATAAFADPLVLTVFPSLTGSATSAAYSLYEDDGDSNAFEAGAFARTLVTAAYSALAPAGATLTVNPFEGAGFAGQGPARRLVAHFRGFRAASGAAAPGAVTIDQVAVPAGAPGCGAPGCWYVVAEAAHSVLCPAGTLVVDSGGPRAVAARTQVVVQF
jgi:hypothetical protein